ncbi:MAG: GAF domain-containing protein [Chloroflexi bacterium]|nr:GAF domain-containing protein [Chloroflexota bacterium]
MITDQPTHILLLEDEPAHTEIIQRAFSLRGGDLVRLSIANTLAHARRLIDSDPPNLIVADWKLPDGEGVELLFQPKDRPDIPVIIMTSHGNERIAVEAIKAGAIDYIVKSPDTLIDLPHIAERALRQWITLTEKARIENELRMRAEAEAIWQTVGKTIVSNQTPDQALATVIDIVKRKMQVETGTVLLWNPESQRIVFSKLLQGDPHQFSSFSLRKGEGIVGWVVENGRSALVPDVSKDIRWQSKVDRGTGFITRSILCVPLIAHDETIGAIELINKSPGTFDERDLMLMESIAAPLAIAIQNARLQQQVRNHLAELTEVFAKVAHAKHEWEQTVDVIDAGIWLVDAECRIMRANRTLAEWLGTTPNALIDADCHSLNICNTFSDYCPVRLRSTEILRRGEVQIPHLAGGTFRLNTYPMQTEGKVIGSVNVLQDITQEKAMQSQLVQAEKLAGIGRLAASLAHEINNPLQALQGCLDLALANLNNVEKQQRYLGIAKSEVERLGTMVQRMLDFYRPSKGSRGPMDLKALVDEVLTLSGKRLQHAKVTTKVEWNGTLPIIYGVANQIKQVFLNLVLNAVDAMPSGGELKIIGQVSEDSQWVCTEFIDSGIGIASQNLDKIFEPFYTTKSTGTGLGLGISHTIVASHGGRLTVDSTIGKGTTFTVWLPTQPTDRTKSTMVADGKTKSNLKASE